MYEHHAAALLPWAAFRRRVARHAVYAGALVVVSLGIGTAGFCVFAGQQPIDAFLNSAMLLGGMGPVGDIKYTSGKIFAALFALYAGLAFLAAATIVFTPIVHRALHRFHLGDESRRALGRAKDA